MVSAGVGKRGDCGVVAFPVWISPPHGELVLLWPQASCWLGDGLMESFLLRARFICDVFP